EFRRVLFRSPYETPSPADLARLMTGELVKPPRARNPKLPKPVNDIVMRALAPDVSARYQRASDLLSDVLALGRDGRRRAVRAAAAGAVPAGSGSPQLQEIHSRLRARETPPARFCWHCRKPLHARSDRCPFWGESHDDASLGL